MVKLSAVAAALAFATSNFVAAQTFTDCNPMEKDCPPDAGLNKAEYFWDFTKGEPSADDWKVASPGVKYTAQGAEFPISKLGDGPTLHSKWHIFFGRLEVKLKAAPGHGIVSSLVLQSSDLDEIDWEMIGSDTNRVQSNFFGKGNVTTYDRGAYHDLATPADKFYTYAIEWSKEKIDFYIDNNKVRTVTATGQGTNGGKNYPQTPSNVRLGNWVGGTPGNSPGTIEWAGGLADFSKSQTYTMYIQSVKVINANPSGSYTYGDRSGSAGSIKLGGAPASNDPVTPAPSASGTTPVPSDTIKHPDTAAPPAGGNGGKGNNGGKGGKGDDSGKGAGKGGYGGKDGSADEDCDDETMPPTGNTGTPPTKGDSPVPDAPYSPPTKDDTPAPDAPTTPPAGGKGSDDEDCDDETMPPTGNTNTPGKSDSTPPTKGDSPVPDAPYSPPTKDNTPAPDAPTTPPAGGKGSADEDCEEDDKTTPPAGGSGYDAPKVPEQAQQGTFTGIIVDPDVPTPAVGIPATTEAPEYAPTAPAPPATGITTFALGQKDNSTATYTPLQQTANAAVGLNTNTGFLAALFGAAAVMAF